MPSGESRATVFAPSASEPLPASLSAYAATFLPLARSGRYLAFCSGVPKKTIGSVPMPVCAPKVVAQDPSPACDSATSIEVTLSRPSPE